MVYEGKWDSVFFTVIFSLRGSCTSRQDVILLLVNERMHSQLRLLEMGIIYKT
jgi:hypothetical protein